PNSIRRRCRHKIGTGGFDRYTREVHKGRIGKDSGVLSNGRYMRRVCMEGDEQSIKEIPNRSRSAERHRQLPLRPHFSQIFVLRERSADVATMSKGFFNRQYVTVEPGV